MNIVGTVFAYRIAIVFIDDSQGNTMATVAWNRWNSRNQKTSSPLASISSTALLGCGLLLATYQVRAADATSADADSTAEKSASSETTDLDKVVVRARNRLEPLKDVPLSISVVTGRELERLESNDLGAITKRAANVSWNQGNQRTSSLSIRGIGKIGQTEAQDPSVGVIVDGVSYAYNAMSSFDFFDVDSVEVTRGPQGTLLGKNTNLGVINIVTRQPSFTPSAEYSLTYGEFDTLLGKFAGGGAIIDGLVAGRVSLAVDKGAGDIKNKYSADNTYQNKDRLVGRTQFLFTPGESFTARLSFDATPRAGENTNGRTFRTPTPATYANGTANNLASDASTRLARAWFQQKANYSYAEYLNQSTLNNDAQQPVVTGTNGISTELDWNLAKFTVTSISAYRNYHFNAYYNDDGTPYDITRSGGVLNNYKQYSQEVRLTSQSGGFLDYQAGLYAIVTDHEYSTRTIWGDDAGAWFASAAQYTALAGTSADGGGRYLAADALNGVKRTQFQDIRNKSAAIFGQANWHFTQALTLTTGVRLTREDRNNRTSIVLADEGYAPELNPVSINNVQLGGFDSVAFGSTGSGNLVAGNSAAQLALADKVAQKYFGVASYNSLSTAQKNQVAAAKAVRLSQIGTLWSTTDAEPFKKTQPAFVVSPSYKINDKVTTYLSWQYGEKAGISQTVNGVSYLTRPEKASAYEWGVKSSLFNRNLILNADIFLTDIKDYQQAVQVYDAYNTALNIANGTNTIAYTSATGNAEKVRAKGLEIDGAFNGIEYTTLRFSAAYNDARYRKFTKSSQPVEWNYTGNTPYRDVSGQTLAGASKYSANVGIDFRLPVIADKGIFHVSTNTAYFSAAKSDVALSDYSWIPAYSLSDVSVGLGTKSQKYDLSVVVKNVLNDTTHLSQTWNSYTPATPRWVYLQFSGRL